uniref:Secreted protein n=1 Tax=Steinernema glaseri TaxID=37863 RepID=A0A1I7XX71_9BILA
MLFLDLRQVLVAVAMVVLVLAFEINNVGDDSDAVIFAPKGSASSSKPCTELYYGQYFCLEPTIDVGTQQPETCQSDNSITGENHAACQRSQNGKVWKDLSS